MNADVPETRHVGAAATEQLQQHVLDLLGELVRLVDDQHRRIEVHVRVVEGRQRLAEDQVFARELSRLRIPERSSRDQFLPDHLRLGFAIPRIEHVGHRQIVHTLQIEAGQIAALRQRFGQRGLAAAAWPLDEQRLAAAERVREVDEGAALDHVACVSEQLREHIDALALGHFAWIYARFGEVLLNHLFCSFNTASAMRRSSGVIRGIAARIFSGESEERISASSSSVSVSPLPSASGSASTACASFGRSVIITKPGVPAGASTNSRRLATLGVNSGATAPGSTTVVEFPRESAACPSDTALVATRPKTRAHRLLTCLRLPCNPGAPSAPNTSPGAFTNRFDSGSMKPTSET